MSDTDWDPTQDDENSNPAVKALRAQVKKLEKELGQFRASKRDTEVSAVLAKLPEKARDKAKRLIGDTDPNEWFEEFGDLFGGVEAPAEPVKEEAAPAADPVVPDAAALQAINAATQGGTAPDFETRFSQQVAQVGSPQDLTNHILAALANQQVKG